MPLTLLFAALGCAPPEPVELPAPQPAEPLRQHVLIVVIDTLRADLAAQASTPHLDALAAAGAQPDVAWAAGTWTVPSVASMFTGMYVRQHGIDVEPGPHDALPSLPPVPVLAEVLQNAGFATEGLYSNDFVTPDLGFGRGFDRWRRTSDRSAPAHVAEVVAGWDDGRRHALYVHLLGPHSPLAPSPEARARHGLDPRWFAEPLGLLIGRAKRNQEHGVRDAYRSAYVAVVEDTDARLGAIVDSLGHHRDDTLIVVTSDHGELVCEHGFCGHGAWVWEELTRVPFVAVGAAPVPRYLSTAALPDLVTRTLGVRHTWPVVAADAPLVSERGPKWALLAEGRTKGVFDGELVAYDLASDPGEQTPLDAGATDLAARRAAWEARVPPATTRGTAVHLHPDTVEALEALGYVGAE